MNNELAKELALAERKSQYDTQCKRVLADRTILSWILKHTTDGSTYRKGVESDVQLKRLC